MKKFVISMGNSLIDFCAWFLLLAILITSIITMFKDFMIGIGVLIIGLSIFVILFYFLYILMSINDNLTDINQKFSNSLSKSDSENINENPSIEENISQENIGLNGKTYVDTSSGTGFVRTGTNLNIFFIAGVLTIIAICIGIFIAAL